jgi:hypothetical protein
MDAASADSASLRSVGLDESGEKPLPMSLPERYSRGLRLESGPFSGHALEPSAGR